MRNEFTLTWNKWSWDINFLQYGQSLREVSVEKLNPSKCERNFDPAWFRLKSQVINLRLGS